MLEVWRFKRQGALSSPQAPQTGSAKCLQRKVSVCVWGELFRTDHLGLTTCSITHQWLQRLVPQRKSKFLFCYFALLTYSSQHHILLVFLLRYFNSHITSLATLICAVETLTDWSLTQRTMLKPCAVVVSQTKCWRFWPCLIYLI